MKDKKLQVFVSSTYTDLREERQAAVEAILSSGNIPAGMELFSAGDESQMTVIERWIDESDVYLLILGGRYGSIEKNTGKSYIQLEYEYALSKQKPLFAVVISDKALKNKVKVHGVAVIEQDNNKELKEFKTLVTSSLVKFWDDKKDIKLAIHETLSDFSYRKELIGWVRGDNLVNTGLLAEQIARLTEENNELRIRLTSGHALYANLTYEQMEELLRREPVEIVGNKLDLFDFFLLIGKYIIPGANASEEEQRYLNKLETYKLIRREFSRVSLLYEYGFTEDGHNFYLKAVYINSSK